MIPKKIYTAWLSENNEMPDGIKKCIESQIRMCKKFGYEFTLITLDYCRTNFKQYKYLQEALDSKYPAGVKFCKATDYLRFMCLFTEGGCFLDSDVEVLKSFDDVLDNKMFIGLEMADWKKGIVVLGTAIMGSEVGHPLLRDILEKMQNEFSGSDNRNYESSMAILNELGVNYQDQFTLYEPEYFHPKNSYTGEITTTDKTITIHHFTKLWTPENNKLSTLQQFKYNIENNINFTFVKRGDGEIACMNGESGGNCDGHPYSPELAAALKDAYSYLHSVGATIVEFEDQKNYNVLLHRTDNNLEELAAFYKAIAKSERPRIFIGPERLSKVALDLFGTHHVVIPEVNAFAFINEFKIPATPDCIYIFCAGMPAKSLIHKLHERNPNATYLDCGSAFDPAVSITRTEQISKGDFWSLYDSSKTWKIIDNSKSEKEPVNNFLLPQETHPERIWTLGNLPIDIKESWDNCLNGRVIYDLGCSTNKTFPKAIGVDVRPVGDIQASIDELPFEDNSGDVVISRHSYEHILDPVKTMREWIRVLKPSGKMIIVLPDHEFINTIDPYYSNGEHLHAYTRDSFKNLLSLFPELSVSKTETVLKDWSFGTVVYKLPNVSIIIPHIEGTREKGLLQCKCSIIDLNYPEHLIEIIVINGPETVPQKISKGLNRATGDFIIYGANDMTFHPDSVRIAITDALELNKGLVSFNEGNILEDRGNECTHFVISKELISKLERGELFSLDLNHVGVDNFLVAQAEKLNQYHHSRDAHITHNHFSHGNEFDETYQKGWKNVDQDRVTLQRKLKELNEYGSTIL